MKLEGKVHPEVTRRLQNWALWRAGGVRDGLSCKISSIYQNGPRAPRAESVVPVLSGEASDTDSIIAALPARHRQSLEVHYLWPQGTDEARARQRSIALNTWKSWLLQAHEAFALALANRNQSRSSPPRTATA